MICIQSVAITTAITVAITIAITQAITKTIMIAITIAITIIAIMNSKIIGIKHLIDLMFVVGTKKTCFGSNLKFKIQINKYFFIYFYSSNV